MKTSTNMSCALFMAFAATNFSFGSDTSAADRLRSQSTLAQQIKLGTWRALSDAGIIIPGDGDYTIKDSDYVPPQDAIGMTQADINSGGTVLKRLNRRNETALDQKRTLVQMIETFEERCLEDKKDINLLTEIANTLNTQVTDLLAYMSSCWTLTHLYTDITDHPAEECFRLLEQSTKGFEEELKNQGLYPQFPVPYSEEETKIPATHDCQIFSKTPQDKDQPADSTPTEDGDPIDDCDTE